MNRDLAMPATGGFVGDEHVYPVRVYFEDTDAAGIVYYPNYLKFAERARTEMLRDLGRSHASMIEGDRLVFVVRRCTADYVKPARLDDDLRVHSRLTGVAGASVDAQQVVRRDGEQLVAMTFKLACVDADGIPARLPPDLRKILTDLCKSK